MPDVVVVGAGPAGLAAAVAAAEAGASVRLLDDNALPGGQIWRHAVGKPPVEELARLSRRLSLTDAVISCGTTVFDAPEPRSLSATGPNGFEPIRYDRLVIATGARELYLPFPGWTLPGVMGAGGAQALLKSGADFAGKRVAVSGSGPLLLAVGAAFAAAGADLVGVFELRPLKTLVGFCLRALTRARAIEGAKYFAQLGGANYSPGVCVVAGLGDGRLESVTLASDSRTWQESCDLLACSFGLVPNIELASLLGCEIYSSHLGLDVGTGIVRCNDSLETTVPGVYVAGEPRGVGGLELALVEGELAGKTAAGVEDRRLKAKAASLAEFRDVLDYSFGHPRAALKLANPDTILCRCEDVRMDEIDPTWSAREAKLYTRIGMGPCQGRVCGPAARCLFGWEPDRSRPPLYPTEVNHVAARERADIP